MEGVVSNYRSAVSHQKHNHIIIVVSNVNTKAEAEKLINKKVTWKSPADKEISGVIKKAHGNKGAVRAIFEKGLPGQAIGSKVHIN